MQKEMQNMDHRVHGASDGPNWRPAIAFVGFAAIALFFLLSEHRAHLLGILPWALFLAFPLLHIFMHAGHGGHSDHGGHAGESAAPQPEQDHNKNPAPTIDNSAHRH